MVDIDLLTVQYRDADSSSGRLRRCFNLRAQQSLPVQVQHTGPVVSHQWFCQYNHKYADQAVSLLIQNLQQVPEMDLGLFRMLIRRETAWTQIHFWNLLEILNHQRSGAHQYRCHNMYAMPFHRSPLSPPRHLQHALSYPSSRFGESSLQSVFCNNWQSSWVGRHRKRQMPSFVRNPSTKLKIKLILKEKGLSIFMQGAELAKAHASSIVLWQSTL